MTAFLVFAHIVVHDSHPTYPREHSRSMKNPQTAPRFRCDPEVISTTVAGLHRLDCRCKSSPVKLPAVTAHQRLRTTLAAMRLSFTWFGVRESLTTEQKAEAAEAFRADGDVLSAVSKSPGT